MMAKIIKRLLKARKSIRKDYGYSLLTSPPYRNEKTMKLYGIPNCNTVKKAQDWLKSNELEYEFHDFKKKGITAEKLTEWFDVFGWEKVINKAGLTFKKLSKEEQAAINSPESAIVYLTNNTSAIKRPVVEVNGKAILQSFKEEDYMAQLKK